jgi:hypothetical protein
VTSVLPIDNSDITSSFRVSLMYKNGISDGSCPATPSNEIKSNELDFWEDVSDMKNSVPKGGKSPLWFPALN